MLLPDATKQKINWRLWEM